MTTLKPDAVVVGGGAAGMAAALELEKAGRSCVVVEREEGLGGILMQCAHAGFGLVEFDEELTGPEFAERFAEKVLASKVTVLDGATALELRDEGERKVLDCCSAKRGVVRIEARAVVLAMGCRERNRGNVRIPGSRPAGVYTAGLAQRLVNIEGVVPGRRVVVIGSGDIGLIMARRMSWIGAKVEAVVEILPYPSGLTRNIVQCLEDFGIPLYLGHQTTRIFGKDRVEGVEIAPLENGSLDLSRARTIPCDTVLLSVGLVPENELSRGAGVELNPATGGPKVDSTLMTSVPGVFACGNVLHVHDLVDWVAEEARRAGAHAAAWLGGERPGPELRVKAGANVRYVAPVKVDLTRKNRVYFRSLAVLHGATLEARIDRRVVKKLRKGHVQPSEMQSIELGPEDFADLVDAGTDAVLEIALVQERL